MSDEALAVVAVGALCPIGLDAAMIAGAANAGISRKQESAFLNNELDPIVLGYLPDDVLPRLNQKLTPKAGLTFLQKRLLRYAGAALQELRAATNAVAEAPLLLATPAPWQEKPIIDRDFLEHLAMQSGIELALRTSDVITSGHAAVFEALRRAKEEYLLTGQAPYVLVGGVDSYVDPSRLDRLQAENRLLAPGVLDGFTPGEGAAFLLLATPATCRQDHVTPLAFIEAVGIGSEKGHRYSDETYTGDGLASAFAEVVALAELGPERPITTVLAGFNGENFHAKEWGVSYLRHAEHFAESFRMEHPAEYAGDMGAALAPVMLVLAAVGLGDGSLDSPVLVWASSDGPERGAALVSGARG